MPLRFWRVFGARRAPALIAGTLAVALAAAGAAPGVAQSNEVNVYTYREAKLIAPLFEAFTKETGIKVNVISANAGLEQRIAAEGPNSPADVLLTVDIGRLKEAVDLGIAQPITVRTARQDGAAAISRSERTLVRSLRPRPRRLCRARSRAAERDQL